MHKKYKTLEERRKEVQQDNKNKYCSNKLLDTVEKSLKTTMIGALHDFEEYFGDLWGNDKGPNEKNKDEMDEYDRWCAARNSILDRGNKAINICRKEVKKM